MNTECLSWIQKVYHATEGLSCLLSPFFFSICAEMILIDAIEEVEKEVRVWNELLKDVKFADNQGMVSHAEKGLQKEMDALSKTGKIM